MFGYTEAEALGKSLDLIIPERCASATGRAITKTMETGTTRYGTDVLQVPAIDKAANRCRSRSRSRSSTRPTKRYPASPPSSATTRAASKRTAPSANASPN